MKKPWSISTTVRNPDRIRGFLKALEKFEGVKFDEEQQIKYQIALIQNKLYKPTCLPSNLEDYYNSIENMTHKQAIEIFGHMKQKSTVLDDDPGLRGRTSIAPLSKMGLVVSKKTISKLYITKFGKNFLDDHFDIGNIFLEYFFKWTLPNPDNKNFSAKNGFNIRPFIATLHIINNVNKEWKKLGNKSVGISKEEFSLLEFIEEKNRKESIHNYSREFYCISKKLKEIIPGVAA